MKKPIGQLIITSEAFKNGAVIPMTYGCQGKNIHPPLNIDGVPTGTKSLVIIVDDPDSPSGNWVHWLVWDIAPNTTRLEAGIVPPNVTQGPNDYSHRQYDGPCPISGIHHYLFKVYAINTTLHVKSKYPTKPDLERAMDGHILAQGQLMGTCSHK